MPGTEKKETKRCGATTRDGGTCKLKAGQGTDHPGYGTCKFHGGNTRSHKVAAAREAAQRETPIEEMIEGEDLQELIAKIKARGDITDLSEELALARAVAVNYVNRADDLERALLRWSASWDKDWQTLTAGLIEEIRIAEMEEDWERYGKLIAKVPDPLRFLDRPKKVTDVSDAVRLLKDVASIVNTIVQHQEAGSIPARDVEVLLVEIANATQRTVREHVADVSTRAGLLAALERAFAEIRLPSWGEAGDSHDESERGHGGRVMDA